MAVLNFLRICRYGVYLRYFQLLFSLTLLVLGCVCMSLFPSSELVFSIVTGIFGLIWYSMLVNSAAVAKLPAAAVLGLEIWLVIWWAISWAMNSIAYNGSICDRVEYDHYKTTCKTGKIFIAVSTFGFFWSIATLILLSVFGIHPIVSRGTRRQIRAPNTIAVGGLKMLPALDVAIFGNLKKGDMAPGEENAFSGEPVGIPLAASSHAAQSFESVRDIKA